MKKSVLILIALIANFLFLSAMQTTDRCANNDNNKLIDTSDKVGNAYGEAARVYKVNSIGEYDIMYEANKGYRAVTKNCEYTLMKFSKYFNNDTAIASWLTINDKSIIVFAGIKTTKYPFFDSNTVVSDTVLLEDVHTSCSKFYDFLKWMYQQHMASSKLTILPNPATNAQIALKFETPYAYILNDSNKTLKIMDLSGNVVLVKTGNLKDEVILNNNPLLKAGVYIAEVWFEDTNCTAKFVIQ